MFFSIKVLTNIKNIYIYGTYHLNEENDRYLVILCGNLKAFFISEPGLVDRKLLNHVM
jgi:hypothetical protein